MPCALAAASVRLVLALALFWLAAPEVSFRKLEEAVALRVALVDENGTRQGHRVGSTDPDHCHGLANTRTYMDRVELAEKPAGSKDQS